MIEQVQAFLDMLEEKMANEAFQTKGLFNLPVLSSLWTLITGDKLQPSDPKMIELSNLMDECVRASGETLRQVASSYPTVATILEKLGIYRFRYIWQSVANSVLKSIELTENDFGKV